MPAQRLLIPFGIALSLGCTDPTRPEESAATPPAAAEASPKGAPIRLRFPGPGDPPLYSELAPDFLFHNDRDAAVVFWREPECVPDDFNLLEVLDLTAAFPGGPPRSLLCPLTVEGVDVWHDPATDPFPFQLEVRGSGAVPIWFFSWSELEAAAADGQVTITELESLPSLRIGHADFYQESIRNSNQGQRHASSSTVARGTMTDGRGFRFHVSERLQDGNRVLMSVQIDIGGA
jgi:hypothetical protein